MIIKGLYIAVSLILLFILGGTFQFFVFETEVDILLINILLYLFQFLSIFVPLWLYYKRTGKEKSKSIFWDGFGMSIIISALFISLWTIFVVKNAPIAGIVLLSVLFIIYSVVSSAMISRFI